MSAQPSAARTRVARVAALVTVWGAIGALVAVHLWMQDGADARGTLARDALARQTLGDRFLHLVPFYLVWAALTPAVVRVCRATDERGWNRTRSLAAHAVAAPLVALAHIAIYTPWSVALADVPPMLSAGELLVGAIARRGLGHLATYAAVAGAWYAWRQSGRARERAVAAAEMAAQLADARLDALRARINPHFLFNALNGIAMLVRRSRPDDAVHTIAALGELLRRALAEGGAGVVPLSEELALCERYLGIERIRFGERLRVAIDAGPGVEDVPVPVFLLQPLVENAVRHGVARRSGPAAITVTARRDGDRTVLRVWNEGPGLGHENGAPGAGIGLRSTRARLESAFGPGAGLTLRDEDGGVAATIILPGVPITPSRAAHASSRGTAAVAARAGS